MLNKKE